MASPPGDKKDIVIIGSPPIPLLQYHRLAAT